MAKKFTLNQIYEMTGEDEYPVIDKKEKLIVVVDKDNYTSKIYKIVHEYPLLAEEYLIDFDFQDLAEKLARGLDPVRLLVETLRSAPPR